MSLDTMFLTSFLNIVISHNVESRYVLVEIGMKEKTTINRGNFSV